MRFILYLVVVMSLFLVVAQDANNGAGESLPAIGGGEVAGLGFLEALFKSIAVIIVTELGDKTFFIAALMAMRHPRLVVYVGALGALAEARELYSQKGTKKNEELEEVEEQLRVKFEDAKAPDDVEAGKIEEETKGGESSTGTLSKLAVMVQAFSLTFVAEWGDRSQIATISLAAVNDPIGVTLGSFLGHAACTGLAVVGGRLLATRISEKQVALTGGIVFLLFAAHSLYVGP